MTNDNLKVNLSDGESNLDVTFSDEFLDREVKKMKGLTKDDGDFLTQAMQAATILKQAIESVGGTFTINEALEHTQSGPNIPNEGIDDELKETCEQCFKNEAELWDICAKQKGVIQNLKKENASLREMVMQLTLRNDELLAAGVSEWHSTKKQD